MTTYPNMNVKWLCRYGDLDNERVRRVRTRNEDASSVRFLRDVGPRRGDARHDLDATRTRLDDSRFRGAIDGHGPLQKRRCQPGGLAYTGPVLTSWGGPSLRRPTANMPA